jgi:hypothetical protein
MKVKVSGEYPPEWPAVAKEVKDAAAWKCERCGHGHEPKTGYSLTVHHLDGDKANLARWNLAALCQRCHLHIQGRVFMPQFYMFEHTAWFLPHVVGYYQSLGIKFEYRAGLLANDAWLTREEGKV